MLNYSPVRLTPAVGVTSGAHYRMSIGHSSPPKLQSRNAAHTTVHSFFFKKTVTPFAIAFRKHNYERVPIVLRNAILDR